ncbi:hypothetical protein NQ317_013582 [Molorchus minor]|uniref:Uncharacterized protein n=1 Tax=Molorchus minor TaxID=1323400 RepID=A0ABQ9IVJ4_9CUCU|nr:hypothetical protein NQ317_013582 [Molorchus minor]
MRKLLNWVKEDTYNNPEIVIMENVFKRDKSFTRYLSSVRDAMEDGVNVVGYTAWEFDGQL